jgi:hypothetical protein
MKYMNIKKRFLPLNLQLFAESNDGGEGSDGDDAGGDDQDDDKLDEGGDDDDSSEKKYTEEEMEAAGLMFRTLEWSMGLSEGSRRELAVLFRELSRFLSGELGGAPGTPKERKEER